MPSTSGRGERPAVCAVCGRSTGDGVRLAILRTHPASAICDKCVRHLEHSMRQQGNRASHPPAQSPYYKYPLEGVPVPFYHELLRVSPIVQTHRHGNFVLTVVSLEVYRESFLVVLWVQAVPQVPENTVVQPLAWVTITLADDQGTQYTGGQAHSTTGTGPGYYHGRVECSFTPTLNPDARRLQVSVPELRWEYHEVDEEGRPTRRIWGEEIPPWSFMLDLPPWAS